MPQTFKQKEAEQILVDAVRLSPREEITSADQDVTHEKLVAMAQELGVSADTLAHVLQERDENAIITRRLEEAGISQARQEFIGQRRAAFRNNLWSCLTVNGLFVTLYVSMYLTDPWTRQNPFFWPAISLVTWGMLLLWHGFSALPTTGPIFERDLTRWRVRQQQRYARRAAKRLAQSRRDGS